MIYLLDTNIVSVLREERDDKNKRVHHWVHNTPSADLYLSVMTLGEIRKGIRNSQVNPTKKQQKEPVSVEELIRWLENDLIKLFGRNIIDVDRSIADMWGRLMIDGLPPRVSGRRKTDRTVDAILAATALVHGLTMVTTDRKDFFGIEGLEVLDPNRN